MSIYQLAMDLGGEDLFQKDVQKKEEEGPKIPFFRYEDQRDTAPRQAAFASYNNATCANENDPIAIVFEQFCSANTFQGIMTTFQQLCDLVEEKPQDHEVFYHRLKHKVTSWKAQSLWSKLDKRASHKEYKRATCCLNTRVLIVGGGPCGLRTGIEVALLGGKAVILEKRDRFSRNNVLHLWPYLIHDLKALGAKKFFGKFCAGSIDHISIRALECILLKVALLVGVEIHPGVTYLDLQEPVVSEDGESRGWRAKISPPDHPASEYEFDVLIGADGKRNTLAGFRRKEFRGKLAIAITANFINRNTQAEARVEEISGVAFIFNQKFFKDLNAQTGIDLENIVYYKDDTHYFVMTAKKHSLLLKGVLIQDYDDPAQLLSKENVNQEALLAYAVEAADVSTRHQLPNLEFAHNHFGQPDVAMFDFTSMFAAEHASRVVERHGYKLLQCLVGDSLLEPFWPTGSGCARGFLGSLDAAWMIRSWASGRMTPLEVLAERESIYQLLSQTTPENVNKNFAMYTIDPSTRYVNLNPAFFKPHQMKCLYDGGDMAYLNEIVKIAEQRSSRYEMIRDSHNLLKWFQRQLEPYRHMVKVLDLASSWQNGLALCALIHKYRPELIDIHALDHSKVAENNQLAFDVAEKEFGISPVTTGKAMAHNELPDKLTMVSYLSQFFEYFRKESVKPAKVVRAPIKMRTRPRSPASKLAALNKMGARIRQRHEEFEKENEDDTLKRPRPPFAMQTAAKKRIREIGDEEVSSTMLQGFRKLEGLEPEPEESKVSRVKREMRALHTGVRGQNKVSSLAKDLAEKFSGKAPTKTEEVKKTHPRPLIQKNTNSDICYFCKKTVYLVEKYTAEGLFFHRGCFRCDYCNSSLRIGGYSFLRTLGGEAKFYCQQHHGLKKPFRRSRKRSVEDGDIGPPLHVNITPKTGTPSVGDSQPDGLSKTPERIEYMTESEQEESEFEQTQHNLSSCLLDNESSESESSSDELVFEDSDISDGEISLIELARTYSEKLKKSAEKKKKKRQIREDDDDSGTETETGTVGASDADWETESDTEKESDAESLRSNEKRRPSIQSQQEISGLERSKEESRECNREKLLLSPTALKPFGYTSIYKFTEPQVKKETKPSPTTTAIMRNRMAFFSAVSEPVRIDAKSFLGLRKPQEEKEEKKEEDKEEKKEETKEKEDERNDSGPQDGKEISEEANQPRKKVKKKRRHHRGDKHRLTGEVEESLLPGLQEAVPVITVSGSSDEEEERPASSDEVDKGEAEDAAEREMEVDESDKEMEEAVDDEEAEENESDKEMEIDDTAREDTKAKYDEDNQRYEKEQANEIMEDTEAVKEEFEAEIEWKVCEANLKKGEAGKMMEEEVETSEMIEEGERVEKENLRKDSDIKEADLVTEENIERGEMERDESNQEKDDELTEKASDASANKYEMRMEPSESDTEDQVESIEDMLADGEHAQQPSPECDGEIADSSDKVDVESKIKEEYASQSSSGDTVKGVEDRKDDLAKVELGGDTDLIQHKETDTNHLGDVCTEDVKDGQKSASVEKVTATEQEKATSSSQAAFTEMDTDKEASSIPLDIEAEMKKSDKPDVEVSQMDEDKVTVRQGVADGEGIKGVRGSASMASISPTDRSWNKGLTVAGVTQDQSDVDFMDTSPADSESRLFLITSPDKINARLASEEEMDDFNSDDFSQSVGDQELISPIEADGAIRDKMAYSSESTSSSVTEIPSQISTEQPSVAMKDLEQSDTSVEELVTKTSVDDMGLDMAVDTQTKEQTVTSHAKADELPITSSEHDKSSQPIRDLPESSPDVSAVGMESSDVVLQPSEQLPPTSDEHREVDVSKPSDEKLHATAVQVESEKELQEQPVTVSETKKEEEHDLDVSEPSQLRSEPTSEDTAQTEVPPPAALDQSLPEHTPADGTSLVDRPMLEVTKEQPLESSDEAQLSSRMIPAKEAESVELSSKPQVEQQQKEVVTPEASTGRSSISASQAVEASTLTAQEQEDLSLNEQKGDDVGDTADGATLSEHLSDTCELVLSNLGATMELVAVNEEGTSDQLNSTMDMVSTNISQAAEVGDLTLLAESNLCSPAVVPNLSDMVEDNELPSEEKDSVDERMQSGSAKQVGDVSNRSEHAKDVSTEVDNSVSAQVESSVAKPQNLSETETSERTDRTPGVLEVTAGAESSQMLEASDVYSIDTGDDTQLKVTVIQGASSEKTSADKDVDVKSEVKLDTESHDTEPSALATESLIEGAGEDLSVLVDVNKPHLDVDDSATGSDLNKEVPDLAEQKPSAVEADAESTKQVSKKADVGSTKLGKETRTPKRAVQDRSKQSLSMSHSTPASKSTTPGEHSKSRSRPSKSSEKTSSQQRLAKTSQSKPTARSPKSLDLGKPSHKAPKTSDQTKVVKSSESRMRPKPTSRDSKSLQSSRTPPKRTQSQEKPKTSAKKPDHSKEVELISKLEKQTFSSLEAREQDVVKDLEKTKKQIQSKFGPASHHAMPMIYRSASGPIKLASGPASATPKNVADRSSSLGRKDQARHHEAMSREDLQADAIKRIDDLISSLTEEKDQDLSPTERTEKMDTEEEEDYKEALDTSQIVTFTIDEECGSPKSVTVNEKYVNLRDRRRRKHSSSHSSGPKPASEPPALDISVPSTSSASKLHSTQQSLKNSHTALASNKNEKRTDSLDELVKLNMSSADVLDDLEINEDQFNLNTDEVTQRKQGQNNNIIKSSPQHPDASTSFSTGDDSYYYTPETGKAESSRSQTEAAASPNLVNQRKPGAASDTSDQKSVHSSKSDSRVPSSPYSPNRLKDAKWRFFAEAPTVVRIDPSKLFTDIGSKNGLSDGVQASNRKNIEKSLELKTDWKHVDSVTPTSPTAGVPQKDMASGENDVFYTPPTTMKGKHTNGLSYRESEFKKPDAKKRLLPTTPAEKGVVAQELDTSGTQTGDKDSMKKGAELGTASKNGDRKRPDSALGAHVGKPSAKKDLQMPKRPMSAAADLPLRSDSSTLSSTESPHRPPSTSDGTSTSDLSGASPNVPRKGKKDKKDKKAKDDKEGRESEGKKEKKRSLLSLFLPSRSVEKKEKEKPKSPPADKGSFFKTKSPPLGKDRSLSPQAKKQSLDRQTPATGEVKMRNKAKGARGTVSQLKEEETEQRRSIYDEFAPIVEDLTEGSKKNKEVLQEKLQQVAPPPAKAPFTSLRPPTATIDEFETESEAGDDRMSVRSFQAITQEMTEEELAKMLRKQQKAVAKRQREAELKRLRIAQEIQRHLEEVEFKQRQVEERGIEVERALRGEGKEIPSDEKDAGKDESELMQQWFNIVHEKNMLVRYESELMVHARELELEDRQSRLEQQLRELMALEDDEKTDEKREEEKKVFEEFMEVVEQRNALVALLEEDRLKEKQQDECLSDLLSTTGFELSPASYVNKLRHSVSLEYASQEER